MTDLVERLRDLMVQTKVKNSSYKTISEAASALEAQEKRIAELERLIDGWRRERHDAITEAARLREWIAHHSYCDLEGSFLSYESKPGRRFNPHTGEELHCTCGLVAALAGREGKT